MNSEMVNAMTPELASLVFPLRGGEIKFTAKKFTARNLGVAFTAAIV
jgi:hypothetical protein